MPKIKRLARFVSASCKCGMHIINLDDEVWKDDKTAFYRCNACKRPLVCKGNDSKFYYIGKEVKMSG